MERRAVSEYIQKDEPRIQQRQERWKGWAASPDALRERQRRHRLLTKTRPTEFAHPNSDPLELAFDCLELLVSVRRGLTANPGSRAALDEAEELVKRLGWGPERRGGPR